MVINSDFTPSNFSYVNLVATVHEDLLNGL